MTCPLHGDFIKNASKHIYGKEGCPACSKLTQQQSNRKFQSFDVVVHHCSILHNNKYRYIKLVEATLGYNGLIGTDTKLVIACKTHGEFIQTINKHIYQKTGCPQCHFDVFTNLQRKTYDEFVADAVKVHGTEFDYSQVEYISAHHKVNIVCKQHGAFIQSPANHILKYQGCPRCQRSGPENAISTILLALGVDFTEQQKFKDCINPKTNYQLRYDFYIPSHNLLIEFDGIYHFKAIDHEDNIGSANKTYQHVIYLDDIKNQYAIDHGIRLLRIPYWDIRHLKSLIQHQLIK
jgi:ssDNA-binding Zn-finger/Zn-ribbon topoisomerase 1